MTGCSADYCTNSTKKGHQMCRFPTASKRRKVWINNTNRSDWVPGANADLCEGHFDKNAWIILPSGKRKLKANAVPTIFHNRLVQGNTSHVESDDVPMTSTIVKSTESSSVSSNNAKSADEQSKELAFQELKDCRGTLQGANADEAVIKQTNQRINRIEKLYEVSEKSRLNFKRQLSTANRRIKKLEKEVRSHQLNQSLAGFLNEDQLRLLTLKYHKIPSWCNDTIVNALKLRFACGTSGYNELLQQNFPLPAVRTLTQRLENFKFIAGSIINDVVEFLKIKVDHFQKDIYKDCMIVLDEMSITPGNFYDTSSNSMIGNVTLPGHDNAEIASKALVFMVVGLSARWKQVIRYDFTGKSVNGVWFKIIIDEITEKLESIGLRVHGVISDMSPANQAMWRQYNINASRYSGIVNFTQHLVDANRKFFFSPDAPHAFKNIKFGFLTNKIITIPQNFVEAFSLPTNIVNVAYLKEVVDVDKTLELKIAPGLKEEYLDVSDHFLKMRVSASTRTISEEVSCAIELIAHQNMDKSDPRYTTSWFIEFLAKWFNVMTNRNILMALSKHNNEKYTEIKTFLNVAIDLFRNMKVGEKGYWKPFQTAALISTKTVLDLSTYLLENGFTFFMTARTTQDCMENVFCILRLKNVIPNALQFKNNLKLISVSQYVNIKHTEKGNYDIDESVHLSDFLDLLKSKKSVKSDTATEIFKNPHNAEDLVLFTAFEMNVIYHVAGYIMSNIVKNNTSCDICVNDTKSNNNVMNSFATLTNIKASKGKICFFVNMKTFEFFMQMERIYRRYYKQVKNTKCNLKTFFTSQFKEIKYTLPNCHKLKDTIIHRYYFFRMKVKSKKIKTEKSVTYSSKSVAMHEAT